MTIFLTVCSLLIFMLIAWHSESGSCHDYVAVPAGTLGCLYRSDGLGPVVLGSLKLRWPGVTFQSHHDPVKGRSLCLWPTIINSFPPNECSWPTSVSAHCTSRLSRSLEECLASTFSASVVGARSCPRWWYDLRRNGNSFMTNLICLRHRYVSSTTDSNRTLQY